MHFPSPPGKYEDSFYPDFGFGLYSDFWLLDSLPVKYASRQGKMTPHMKRENSFTVLSGAILNIHIFICFVYLQFRCVIFAANKSLRGEINVLVKGNFQASL